METLRDTAETLIYKGASIVPVIDKRPYISDWSNIRGEDILEDIYTIQWKKANGIGILCGEASGIICLDIDIGSDNQELKTVREEIEKALPPIMCGLIGNPERPPARFFRYNGEKAQKFKNIDVEILSDGNQKVIPPSKHPAGRTYQWVGQPLTKIELDDLPDLPKHIITMLEIADTRHKKKKTRSKATAKHTPSVDIVKTPGRCASGSHNYLSSLAVALFHQHIDKDTIIKRIMAADKEINSDSDYLYFECPSRKEFKRGNSMLDNATQFVSEVEERNIEQRGPKTVVMEVSNSDKLMRTKGANGQTGHVINNLYNVRTIIEMIPGLSNNLWYDDFHHKFMGKKADGKIIEWADEDDLQLCMFMQKQLNMAQLKDEMVRKARIAHSMENVRNEPREWMETLQWDGTKRVESFFAEYMGCVDGEYTQAVSKNFWVSMVARIMMPGCKVDNMVILEGPQGAGKSKALKAIGGKWYVECNEPLHSKDFLLVTHGNLIVEIGELDSFNKAETNTIKKVVSTAVDRFRAPYARGARDYPRQCIFVGTTNDDDYLKDATGGRRFWPIACGDLKYDLIVEHREQLFAEAAILYNAGANWWEVPEMSNIIQASRTEEDPWTDKIEEYLEKQRALNRDYVTVVDILEKCLEFDTDKMDRRHSLRVGKVLKILGWGKKKTIREDGKIMKGYFKAK